MPTKKQAPSAPKTKASAKASSGKARGGQKALPLAVTQGAAKAAQAPASASVKAPAAAPVSPTVAKALASSAGAPVSPTVAKALATKTSLAQPEATPAKAEAAAPVAGPASTEAAAPAQAVAQAPTSPRSLPTIAAYQRALAQAGCYPGLWDGVYGDLTRHATARFQALKGLPVSGDPSPATLVALGF